MKIRSGFVSNSSTSSFVMVGITLQGEWLEKLIKLTGVEWPEELVLEGDDFKDSLEEEFEEALGDASYQIASKFGLKSDGAFIGVRISNVYNSGDSNFDLSKVSEAIAQVKEKLGVTDDQIVIHHRLYGIEG